MVSIDVFIPTKNNAKTLEACLESIKREVPYRTIYAVDADSNDGTKEILIRHGVVVVPQDKIRGLGRARQIGHDLVQSPIYLAVDADAILPKDYFEIYAHFRDKRVAWVTGAVIFGEGILAKFYRFRIRYNYYQPSPAASFFRKSALDAIGGWSIVTVGEDSELLDRLKLSTFKQVIIPEVEVMHPRTMREELKAHVWYGGAPIERGGSSLVVVIKAFASTFRWCILTATVDPRIWAYLVLRAFARSYGAIKKEIEMIVEY